MRLLPIRHAETALNHDRRVQGLSQSELTELGRKQAHALAGALEQEPLAAVYSSPLTRALQTARPVAERRGLAVQAVAALQEADAGDLEGLPASDLRRLHPDFMARWGADATTAMPGGESLQQVQDRAWPFLAALPKRHEGEAVLVVTHNFVIQVALAKMLGMATLDAMNLRIGLAAVNEVEWRQDRWHLVRLNEACHLHSLPITP